MKKDRHRLKYSTNIAPSAWQTRQIDQVIGDFPDVFSEVPWTAKWAQHHIITSGIVVQSPSRPIPLTLQDIIEQDVLTMLKLGVVEVS